jgi:RHS repeat-associated protein
MVFGTERGQLIAEYKNSTTLFVHDNNIGTSTILSSVAGAVADCNALYPFGEQDNTICSTSNLTSHKFTGKERDTESNLDNFGARYYSSAQGRFLTADWSAIPAPVPYANLSDPQTLNLYAYVGNNPLGRVDPDGHQQASTGTTQCGNAQCPDTAGAAAATGADKKGPQNVLVLKVGAGGEIGAEAKFGPATAKLSASAGVEADVPNQSANASVKMNADIKLGPAQLGGEAKLGLVSADENGLHAEFKPSASIGIGGERKAFGTGADHDTDEGFVASGTIKAGVVKVEIGVNLTALGNRISDAGHAVMQFLGSPVKGLDFSGEVPRFAPPGP